MRTPTCINTTCSPLSILFVGPLINQCFMQVKPLKVNVSKKKVRSHPQQLPNPCNAAFYYFCKRKKKKEINRDSSCVILSKICTLSTPGVISWKAKRRRVRGWGGGGEKRTEVTGKPRHCVTEVTVLLQKLFQRWNETWPAPFGAQKLLEMFPGDVFTQLLQYLDWRRNFQGGADFSQPAWAQLLKKLFIRSVISSQLTWHVCALFIFSISRAGWIPDLLAE